MSQIKLVVGLGNPGPSYEKTRHNVGFWALDALVQRYQLTWKQAPKGKAQCCRLTWPSQEGALLLKPSRYMNESGFDVSLVASYYQIKPSQIMILHDELDFEPGVLRVKVSGGHGGHNGIRNIAQLIGDPGFVRVRFGIGRSKGATDRYVLSIPPSHDMVKIKQAVEIFVDESESLIGGDFDQAVQRIHLSS